MINCTMGIPNFLTIFEIPILLKANFKPGNSPIFNKYACLHFIEWGGGGNIYFMHHVSGRGLLSSNNHILNLFGTLNINGLHFFFLSHQKTMSQNCTCCRLVKDPNFLKCLIKYCIFFCFESIIFNHLYLFTVMSQLSLRDYFSSALVFCFVFCLV